MLSRKVNVKEVIRKLEETITFLNSKNLPAPEVGIILGTGLGQLADKIEKAEEIEYTDIPNFPLSTVESHSGKMIFGKLSGKNVVAFQGRFHYYEGYNFKEVTYPVRVMKALGVSTLVVSNACGGLNTSFTAGDIMLINDHINLLPGNPLIGKNSEELGPRFPDMSQPYSFSLLKLAKEVAAEKGIKVQEGVYAAMTGPCLETRAEYRMLNILGADVIGMSTVPEVIAAVHAGLNIIGFSVITDLCDPDHLEPVSIDKIIATAEGAEPALVSLIEGVLKKMDKE